MKFKRVNVNKEKQVLTGMIMSTSFLKKIVPVFSYEYFDSSASKQVAEWVLDYYDRYSKAPKAMVEDIYRERTATLDDGTREWIALFLDKLSRQYEKQGFNADYLFDVAVKFFRVQKMRKASQSVLALLDKGKVDQAESVWLDSVRMPEAEDIGIDPFNEKTIRELYTKDKDRVSLTLGIPWIDNMVGPVKSGWLAVFLGPMKRGKTFALLYVAMRAVLKELNVVVISLEMEELDIATRVWMNAGSLRNEHADETLRFPYFKDKELGIVEYREEERPALTLQNVLKTAATVRQVSSSNVRFKSFPMGGAGLDEINQYLDVLEVYENFTPHVIIVDYIGAMRSPRNVKDVYNHNSAGLKAIAQKRKAVVFSGHQGTRATLEKLNMGPADTSQEIRILANVDCMYGLNQTEAEMDEGIMRINVVAHRHRKFTRSKQAKVLQQLSAGQFVLDSVAIDTPRDATGGGKNNDGLKGYSDGDS